MAITHPFVNLKPDGIDTSLVQPSAWNAAHVIDNGTITTAMIADNAIIATKIADTAVTSAKIQDTAVTTAKIADANVTTSKIADANVTTVKVATGAIGTSQLGQDITTAGKALLDDASASDQRTTLGLAAIAATGNGADLVNASVTTAKLTTAAQSGRRIGQVLKTASSGSDTLPAGTCVIIAHLQGAGGGGGGAGGGANAAAGAGGDSGRYIRLTIGTHGVTLSPTSYSWTCGAGGTAGVNTGGNGGQGGDATLTHNAVTFTAKGGGGGTGVASAATTFATIPNEVAGSSSGDFSTRGHGTVGVNINGYFYAGTGGTSPMGSGGLPSASTGSNGGTGENFGGGGGGAIAQAIGRSGGVGGAAAVFLEFWT